MWFEPDFQKQAWRAAHAVQAREMALTLLIQRLAAGISPDNVIWVCPNETSQARWASTLRLNAIPIRGTDDAGVIIQTAIAPLDCAKQYVVLPELDALPLPVYWHTTASWADALDTAQSVVAIWQPQRLSETKETDWWAWLTANGFEDVEISDIRRTPLEWQWNTVFPAPVNQTPVLSKDQPLKLSPSAIETYVACPRRYFYQHGLRLQEVTLSLQGMIGIVVHTLMERWHQDSPVHDPTAWLEAVLQPLAMHPLEPENLVQHGFSETLATQFAALPAIQKHAIARYIHRAMADTLDSRLLQPAETTVKTEYSVHLKDVPGIPGLELRGRVDCLEEHADGRLRVVDYKTSRSQFLAATAETNRKPLLNALTPIDWDQPDWRDEATKGLYQLPLYWLMLKHNAAYSDRPIDVAIQCIRWVPSGDKVHGATQFGLSHAELTYGEAALLDYLQHGLYEPLKTAAHFPALGDPQTQCRTCPYSSICEGPEAADPYFLHHAVPELEQVR